jgi:hypothetical protein
MASAAIPLPEEEAAREQLRQACAALDAAELQGQAVPIAQALTGVARAYNTLQARRTAEAYLEMALRWAQAAQATDLAVDTLCELCDTGVLLAEQEDALASGSGQATRERVRDHVFDASALAPRVADAEWEVKVLLRVSDVLNRLGDHEDAALLQGRAMRLMAGGDRADVALLPSIGRLADG